MTGEANGSTGSRRSRPKLSRPSKVSEMHTLAPARSPNGPLLHHLHTTAETGPEQVDGIETEYPLPVPPGPAATPVRVPAEPESSGTERPEECEPPKNVERKRSVDIDRLPDRDHCLRFKLDGHPSMMITSELLRLIPGEHDDDEEINFNEDTSESYRESILETAHVSRMSMNHCNLSNGPKTWSQQDMESALDALRNHNMSLTKASSTFGIPSTTLWQRAHRLGIDTPKKEGPSKSWSEGNLHSALQALRTGTISANKASKAYGIPSSTLYKIARREGIRLAAPFNAAPTAWRPGDLERALQSIRSGHSSVQRASTEFGIPTGTLYGRCKREGIELSRSNPTPWSEDAMGEALEAVRVGQMSINQAAIHFNLPYSSLYGRFKRCKYEGESANTAEPPHQIHPVHEVTQPLPPPRAGVQDHNGAVQQQIYSEYRQHNLSSQSGTNNNVESAAAAVDVTQNNQDCVPNS